MESETRKTRTGHVADLTAIVVLVFGVILAHAIPDSILKDYPVLRNFTDVMVKVIPVIEQLVHISHFSDVTLFFSAAMWSLVPVLIGILLFVPGMRRPETYLVEYGKTKKWQLALAVPALAGVLFWMTHGELPSNMEKSLIGPIFLLISESRFWMGIFGTAMVFAAAGWVIFLVIWLRYFRQIYFSNR